MRKLYLRSMGLSQCTSSKKSRFLLVLYKRSLFLRESVLTFFYFLFITSMRQQLDCGVRSIDRWKQDVSWKKLGG